MIRSQSDHSSEGGEPESVPRRSMGYVDYDDVADRYRRGRALPEAVLAIWGEVVARLMPIDTRRVLDVGAGTGVFADAWSSWSETFVIGVEPAAAMASIGQLAAADASFVSGVAEQLPVRDDTVDVVWVSTALHHFIDAGRAVGEFARVLRHGGRVLVRTYVSGRTEMTYLSAFPNRSKWESRFHTEAQLRALFTEHGLRVVEVLDVLEWTETYAQSAEWASTMRHADSTFTALSDDEMAVGLATLRSTPDVTGRIGLTLLVFETQ